MKEYIVQNDIDNPTNSHGYMFGRTISQLIRCKDCKYWYQDFDGKCIASTPYGTDTDEDDFCSRAERKEE